MKHARSYDSSDFEESLGDFFAGEEIADNKRARATVNASDFVREEHCGARRKRRRGKKDARSFALRIVTVAVIAVVCFGGWLGVSALSMKDSASQLLEQVNTIKLSMKAGDIEGALSQTDALVDTATKVSQELSGPQWTIASVVPIVGDDVRAVRSAVDVLEAMGTSVLKPLSQLMQEHPIGSLISSKGVDGETMVELCGLVAQTAPAMDDATAKMTGLPTPHISQVKQKLKSASELMVDINGLYQRVAQVAPYVRELLGVDSPRTYLIVAQNSAEIRATGGFPGALGPLTVTGGEIDLQDFDTPLELMSDSYREGWAFPDGNQELFMYNSYSFPRDAGYNPIFSYAARAWLAAYEDKTGRKADGLISLTPSMVQDILGLVGEITLSDGTVLNGQNATKILQHDLYWKYIAGVDETYWTQANDSIDGLFAEAAQGAFKKLMGGLNAQTLMAFAQKMASAAEDMRLMVYFSDEAEQKLMDQFGLGARIGTDATNPVLGVYFSVARPSKLGWYADITSTVSSGSKNSDGTMSYQVNVAFANVMNSAEVEPAGEYIAGTWEGDMDAYIQIIAPAGSMISDFKSTLPPSDRNPSWNQTVYDGLQMAYLKSATLKPGQVIECAFTVTTAKDAQPLQVKNTPTLTSYR